MQLPPAECALLSELRSDLPRLRGRVRQLREVGWTLSAVGAPLSAPRSTVRSWQLHPDHSPHPDPVPRPPASPPSPLPTPTIPPDDALLISQLAPSARLRRALTPPDSPAALAAARLDALVLHHSLRGVSTAQLARTARVSYRAMRVRVFRARREQELAA